MPPYPQPLLELESLGERGPTAIELGDGGVNIAHQPLMTTGPHGGRPAAASAVLPASKASAAATRRWRSPAIFASRATCSPVTRRGSATSNRGWPRPLPAGKPWRRAASPAPAEHGSGPRAHEDRVPASAGRVRADLHHLDVKACLLHAGHEPVIGAGQPDGQPPARLERCPGGAQAVHPLEAVVGHRRQAASAVVDVEHDPIHRAGPPPRDPVVSHAAATRRRGCRGSTGIGITASLRRITSSGPPSLRSRSGTSASGRDRRARGRRSCHGRLLRRKSEPQATLARHRLSRALGQLVRRVTVPQLAQGAFMMHSPCQTGSDSVPRSTRRRQSLDQNWVFSGTLLQTLFQYSESVVPSGQSTTGCRVNRTPPASDLISAARVPIRLQSPSDRRAGAADPAIPQAVAACSQSSSSRRRRT